MFCVPPKQYRCSSTLEPSACPLSKKFDRDTSGELMVCDKLLGAGTTTKGADTSEHTDEQIIPSVTDVGVLSSGMIISCSSGQSVAVDCQISTEGTELNVYLFNKVPQL